jgi:hypothetical protein
MPTSSRRRSAAALPCWHCGTTIEGLASLPRLRMVSRRKTSLSLPAPTNALSFHLCCKTRLACSRCTPTATVNRTNCRPGRCWLSGPGPPVCNGGRACDSSLPNWSVRLPDFPFLHDEPDAFATSGEIVEHLRAITTFSASKPSEVSAMKPDPLGRLAAARDDAIEIAPNLAAPRAR